jgi:hypothetical protein
MGRRKQNGTAEARPVNDAPWRNRIVGYGEEAPDQLLANPSNWRIHPAAQQAALKGVLREVGIVQNVLVNKRTGHMVDGHLRAMIAISEGQPTIPITYVDLDEAEEALVLAALDPVAAMAATDSEKLTELLRGVQTGDAAVQKMLADLLGETKVLPGVDSMNPAVVQNGTVCPSCGYEF